MLLINAKSNIPQCESYLRRLEESALAETRSLSLAHKLRYTHCGGLAALIQVIITWARKHDSPTLVPFVKDSEAATILPRFMETLSGLIAVLMANQVVTSDHATNITRAAYDLAHQRVATMDRGKLTLTQKGLGAALICADQTSLRALRRFYDHAQDGAGELRSERDFVFLAAELLDASISSIRIPDLSLSPQEFGVFLRELIANTHDHARFDEHRVSYKKSVRGVYTAQHLIDPERIDELAGEYKPLELYLEATARRRNSTTSQFFEFSVFDSGPGLASRLLKKPISDEVSLTDERSAVERCFLEGVSSDPREGRGFGLPRVLSRLKSQGGFLRIRTGHFSLYKAFTNPSTRPLVEADFQLVDGADPQVGNRLAWAAGTTITLLLPLKVKT